MQSPQSLDVLLQKQINKSYVIHTYEELCHPSRKHYLSDGWWRVTLGNPLFRDPFYWTVINFPILALKLGLPEDDEVRLYQKFTEEYVVPGSLYSRTDLPFDRLTSFLPLYAQESELGTVVWRADQKFNRFNILTKLSDDIRKETPLIYQLLYIALQEASVDCRDPFHEWGLAWAEGRLYFHYGRALNSLRQNRDFNQTVFRKRELLALMEELGEPRLWKGPLKKCVDVEWEPRKHTQQIMLLNPLWEDELQTRKYHPRDVVFDVSKLVQFTHNLIWPKATHTPTKPPTPRSCVTGHRHLKHCGKFGVDLVQLGVEPPADFDYASERMDSEIGIAKFAANYYLSLPVELVRAYPEIARWKYYENLDVLKIINMHDEKTETPVPRVELGDVVRTQVFEGERFFARELMYPDGEVIRVTEAVLKYYYELPHDDVIFERLEGFNTFLKWVWEAEGVCRKLGRELNSLVDKDSGCPVQLTTVVDRLQFLLDLALRNNYEKLAYTKASHGRRRSPKICGYDRLAVWMVENFELDALPIRLTQKQRGEYIAKRWLPWRQGQSLMSLIDSENRGPKDFRKKRLKQLNPDVFAAMEEVLAIAEEKFGPVYLQSVENFRMPG